MADLPAEYARLLDVVAVVIEDEPSPSVLQDLEMEMEEGEELLGLYQGGRIVEREAPVNASNVQIVCPECNKRTRIGKRLLEDGRRVRVCAKCKGVMDK